MNDLVSIVVPVYNVEKYLDKCLKSISCQTYKKIEVIIVNDGSKDDSRAIAKKWCNLDNRFVLVEKENGGLSSARNHGLDHVHGEFVVFIDSDDFIDYNYIKNLYLCFDDNTDIVIGEYAIYEEKTNKYFYHSNMLDDRIFIDMEDKRKLISYLMYGPYTVMPIWKNMYRMSFLTLNNLRFTSERLIYAEDFLFHIEAYFLAKKIKFTSQIVYFHLVNEGSLSQGYRDNMFEMKVELYKRIMNLLQNFNEKELIHLYSNKIPDTIGSCIFNLSKCKFSQAKKNIDKVLKNDFVKNAYNRKFNGVGLVRYRVLFYIGKYGKSTLCVLLAKFMLLLTPLYRYMQRRIEYIPE